MEQTELMQKIEQLNSRVSQLNGQRLTDLGKKQTLQKQITTALADYKSVYGVELTEDSLDAEYNKVEEHLIEESNSLSKLIALIDEGKYSEADAFAKQANGLGSQENGSVKTSSESVKISSENTVQGVDNVTNPVGSAVQNEGIDVRTQPAGVQGVPTAPSMPAPAPNVNEVEDSEPIPAPPTPPTAPSAPTMPNEVPSEGKQMSFADILSGSDFK